jgi:uncharacterized protein (DUF983 family)
VIRSPTPDPPPPLRLLGRAGRLRCPRCGAPGVFAGWFRMRERCPGCDLRFERGEEGYFIGGYTLNLIAAEVLLVLFLLAIGLATWPDVPWRLLQYGGGALMIAVPILFYPFSKTLWLALDLIFRPGDEEVTRSVQAPEHPDRRPPDDPG